MATMQHKIFFAFEFIKTESATAVQRAFLLRFNIQPPMRKNICRWNHGFIIFPRNMKQPSWGQDTAPYILEYPLYYNGWYCRVA